MKKRSPKEVIEATLFPEIEHAFIKYPGEEVEDITNYSSTETQSNRPPIVSKKFYTSIHTHPTALPKRKRSFLDTLFPGLFHPESIYGEREEIDYSATPASRDMRDLLKNKNEKTMVIAVREPDTGAVRGYTIIKKTKRTPKKINPEDIKIYKEGVRGSNYLKTSDSALREFAQKYSLKYRFVPAEGFEINAERTQFVRKSLVSRVSAFFFLIAGLFFFALSEISPTGNVIGSSSSADISFFLSIGLMIIGGVLLLQSFKKRVIKR